MVFDEVEDVIEGIKLFWIYCTLATYLLVPIVFVIHVARRSFQLNRNETEIAFNSSSESIDRALKWVVALLIVAMLILPTQDLATSAVRLLEQNPSYFWDILISHILIFFSGIAIYAIHLLFPISTILMLSSLFMLRRDRIPLRVFMYISIWVSLRIAYIVGHNIAPYSLNLNDHDPRPVFGGLIGALVVSALAVIALGVGRWLFTNARIWQSYFVASIIGAPVVVLIWGTFDIGFVIVAADYSVTVLTIGWWLSVNCRAKATADAPPTDEDAIVNSGASGPERSATRRSTFVPPSWLRVLLLVVMVIMPAVVLKWVLREVLELPLDGSIATWIVIWFVALVLGASSYVGATLYEVKERALAIGVSAFVVAFAIMILNLGEQHVDPFPGHFNAWGVMLSIPLAFSSLIGLIVTVVVGRWRWSLPFWTGCLFVYIFAHSFAGHRYVVSLSELHLFSWINMSLIVFVFLLAIPAYLASDRVQLQEVARS